MEGQKEGGRVRERNKRDGGGIARETRREKEAGAEGGQKREVFTTSRIV